jgi:hypothetical protein
VKPPIPASPALDRPQQSFLRQGEENDGYDTQNLLSALSIAVNALGGVLSSALGLRIR